MVACYKFFTLQCDYNYNYDLNLYLIHILVANAMDVLPEHPSQRGAS